MNYTATKFYTVGDKEKTFNALVKFVKSGFEERLFTKHLYRHLSNMYRHIAHYDRSGFYDTWFNCADRQVKWFDRVMKAAIYGEPDFTFSDVEQAFQSWLKEEGRGYVTLAKKTADHINEVIELNELERLVKKYPDYVKRGGE